MGKLSGIAWVLPALLLVTAPASVCARPQTIVQASKDGAAAQALPQNQTQSLRADSQGLLTVESFVNGRGPFRFIVDTGANRSVVSRGLAQRLGLPPAGESAVHGVTGVRVADMVHVESLKAGTASIERANLPILENDLLGGADGMLGMETMAGKRLEIDNQTNTLTLQDSAHGAGKNWRRIGVKLQFGQLAMVRGVIDNVPITIVIDTGAERSLVNTALTKALEQKAVRRIPGTRITSAAKPVIADNMLHISNLSLGDQVALSNASALIGDFHVFDIWGLKDKPALLLGMDVLSGARAFAIDYERRELQIKLF